MMERCDKNLKGYEDATVCEEWKNVYTFIMWYMKNTYNTKQWNLQLDKDLFKLDNKLYSPETCCMLPRGLNILISNCTSRNGLLPGVTKNLSGSYTGTVSFGLKKELQVFKTEEEAFQFYKEKKEHIIKVITKAYVPVIPQKIYDALMIYEVKPIRHGLAIK